MTDNDFLHKIEKEYIKDLIIFFSKKYYDKEIKLLDDVISNVKMFSKSILEINYKFDESIWHPMEPDDYGDYVKFYYRMRNSVLYAVEFKLSELDSYIDKKLYGEIS